MIDPLYGGQTAHHVFQTLLDEPMVSPYDAVRETWKPVIKGDFETGWRKALHDGWIADTAFDIGLANSGMWHPSYHGSRAHAEGFASKSSSGPIRISMTAAGPTWAGCRSCPSR